MGSKSFNSISLVSVAIIGAILISQGLVEARGKNINPFCQKATFLQLCNIMVGGATTPKDASLNSLNLTRALAAKIPSLTVAVTQTVDAIEGLDPVAKATVIKQCNDVFTNVVDDLDQSIVAVQTGDNFTAATHLSAISFSECSDAMEEFGATFPMNKVVTQFERHVSNCLAVVQP